MKINLSEKAHEKIFRPREISPENFCIKITLDDIG
ncbi:hypothetical protein SAMN04488692_1229 [Halarsenatibacter silvermanii]|uniref:Uncharacterized protein n=1 Tax=Halarsenatibacter silvermanii TaxID=321763 RepID=A0A1G9RHH1_9FIRM|nr:hypothetical protein SAMN04488692_1229 [Halarsenatibacter silvermanii]